ncbi:MAG: SDR family NAD(P)-dependent oxidoreductase [Beijerinckiaceae bacterium]
MAGEVILVTGAGGGLGGAMAQALAGAGHTVAAADVDKGRLDALAAKCAGAAGKIMPFQVDLGDKAAAKGLVQRVVAECGDLFMLVNNAGVGQQVVDPDYSGASKPFWETDIDDWEKLIHVNTRAPLILTQQAVKHFMGKGRGRVINVTTSFNTMIMPGVWAYGQSKAALEAATASLSGLLAGTPVTMNILVPGGPANTALLPDNTGMDRAKIIQPPVMGPPIVFLASPEAADFNGKRFIALMWDSSLPGKQAAEKASAPAAWPGFGVQSAAPKPA